MMIASTEQAPSRGKQWRDSTLAGLASFMDSGTIIATGIALVLFTQPFGLSTVTVGILSALLTFSIAAGALVGGRLGDVVGRKRIYTIDLLVYAFGLLVLITAVGEPSLYVGVIIAGFAMGADIPTSLSLISETTPHGRKGLMVSWSSALWILGILVILGLSSIVAQYGATGARILYGFLFVVALVTWFLRRSMKESAEWKTQTEAVRVAPVAEKTRVRDLFSRSLIGPLLATTLFYIAVNLPANTIGQFQTFLFVNVAHVDAGTASLLGLASLPIAFMLALVFMRVADRRIRISLFWIGAVIGILGFLWPVVAGFTPASLVVMLVAVGVNAAFAGEALYKVWSQESFPTLVRSTAQGTSFGVTRAVTAGFAVFTPTLAVTSPSALLLALVGCLVVSAVIGGLIIPRGQQVRGLQPWQSTSSDVPNADAVGAAHL